ncbi:MAG: 2-phosphosulfolactate phosphatase [Solirubrobacteraceae bacterium]
MTPTVAIARYPSLGEADEGWAVVGIDVIRATTTAITAVAAGRRCFPVASLEEAVPLAARLHNPLLVGELGGNMPFGFHLQNSPAEMERNADRDRPVILLSTSGTALLCAASKRAPTYAACLRNVSAQVKRLRERHERVLLLAGESRGEFREEDRLCCARLARGLVQAGYEPRDVLVQEIIKKWGEAADDAFMEGHSVQYLSATGQIHDAEFILDHIDDLDETYEMRGGELLASGSL